MRYGARWLDTSVPRVALCRSVETTGSCARLYFEVGGERGFPADWRFNQGQRDDLGACRGGAIRFDAPSATVVSGAATWSRASGLVQLDLTVTFDDDSELDFDGTATMGEGPCP